jgi:multidrug efflux pump subunit AcrB
MFLLTGVAHYLFVPLAEAVVFAMLASYFFSRTLIPTLAMYLLREPQQSPGAAGQSPLDRVFATAQRAQQRLRARYEGVLKGCLSNPGRFALVFLLFCGGSLALWFFTGQDFFPAVDTGEIRLHIRAPTGTRIEQTAQLADHIERRVRELIPAKELGSVLDNIGLPVSGINLTYDSSSPIGSADADILISLTPKHQPTAGYVDRLRLDLNRQFPGVSFAFLPADIISQILNFGLPSPVDIQIVGDDLAGNRGVAADLMRQLTRVNGLVDLRIQQPSNAPSINIDVDRAKALQAGFQQKDIAQNLLIALSGSAQTTPNFWLNPKNNVSYPVTTQTPQYQIDSLQSLANIPLSGVGASAQAQILGSLGSVTRTVQNAVVSHYNVQPVIDIFATTSGRDLGGVASDVNRIVAAAQAHLPAGSSLVVRGQIDTMQASFAGLEFGIAMAIVLVYLLMVVNFQSWVDPLIILSGLPGALAGILWMLFLTGTTMSVPALTGGIMCIGVATANSILLISFARERQAAGLEPKQAAMEAGVGRFRPVLMTASAMLIGMLPMALGLGDGGEQNAPLGRAVIGGLLFGTVTTLLFVPIVFAAVHNWLQRRGATHPSAGSSHISVSESQHVHT